MDAKAKSDKCFILYLSLHCTSTGQCSDHILTLNSLVPTVRDVKEKIEEEFQVPRCLQELTLNGRCDFEDHSTLASLYIPNKSTARVCYSSSAQVQFFGTLMEELASLKETVSNLPQTGKLEWSLIENCQRQLHTALYTYLLPWASLSVHANRKYIIQEGGITLVLDLLAVLYPGLDGDDVPSQTAAVNRALAGSLLVFIWGFAETVEDCHFVLEQGAAELLLRYLHLVSSDGEAQALKTFSANALGCVLA